MRSLNVDIQSFGWGQKINIKRVITLTLLFTNAYFGFYFLARLFMRG